MIDFAPRFLFALFAIVGIALLARNKVRGRGRQGEALVARILKRSATDTLNDVYLEHRPGVVTQVDHLALTPEGIWVIETKHYQGKVKGKPEDARWIQQCGRKRHEFHNPIHQNQGHVRAVRKALGKRYSDVPVIGYVVFSADAALRVRSAPDVLTLKRFKRLCRSLGRAEVSPRLQSAWQCVVGQVRDDRAAKREHQRTIRHARATG